MKWILILAIVAVVAGGGAWYYLRTSGSAPQYQTAEVTRGDLTQVVTATGELQPCSMQFRRYSLANRAHMIEEFTRTNGCDECYVSIRSYLDKSFPQLLGENVRGFFSFSSDER